MKLRVKDLVFLAMYMAMFMVLDFVTNQYQLLQMPNGGSLGLGVIPLLVASYHLGWKLGLVGTLLSVLLMFITGPMFTPNLLGFVLDYVLAFGVYGLASLFPNFKYFYSGVLITGVLRYLIHTISGVLIWETQLWASFVYNFPYMAATTAVAMIVVPILMSRIKPITK